MAPLSTHPFYIALEEAMESIAAVSQDLNHAASCVEEAAPWRSQLRKLDQDQMNVLRTLQQIESEFARSTKE